MRSFANKSTNSKGKTKSESYQDSVIKRALRFINKLKTKYCAILVGHPSGLDRHIKRMLALGIKENHIVIFEICPKLAAKLRRVVQLRKLKCQVVEGDLVAGVRNLTRLGYKFAYIEFDGVEKFGEWESDLFTLVKQFNIPVLVTQGSARGQSKKFKEYLWEKGHRRSWCEHNKRISFNLKEKAPVYIKNKLTKYISSFITYGGVGGYPMYMSISIAKGV